MGTDEETAQGLAEAHLRVTASGERVTAAIDDLRDRLAESRAFWAPIKARAAANAQRAHEMAGGMVRLTGMTLHTDTGKIEMPDGTMVDRLPPEYRPAALVGLAELAQRAGTSTGYVRVLRRRHADFPAPVVELAMGPVWEYSVVEAWLAKRRKNGRPRG